MLVLLIVVTTSVIGSFAAPELFINDQDERIINGTDAKPGQYPYHVSLQSNGRHRCAASILTSTWALTASHCVSGTDQKTLTILAGTIKLSEGGVKRQVAKYIMHEKYSASNNWINDIALLQLTSPLEFNDDIQPIKLPVQGREYPARTPVTVAGWGTLWTGGASPDILQTVDILTFSDEECGQYLENRVYPSHICAGVPEGNKGECNGDSGGALIGTDGAQVGIVSWSFKPCTKPPYPSGVYTQVSYYVDWIKRHIQQEA